jgi:hypothetical protein
MLCGGQSKREALAKLWCGELAPQLEVRPCSAQGKGLGLFAGERVGCVVDLEAGLLWRGSLAGSGAGVEPPPQLITTRTIDCLLRLPFLQARHA